MNATGAFCDVPANGARTLTRWIGNVVKTKMGDGTRDVRVDDSGLHASDSVLFVDTQDLSHSRHLDNNTAFQRKSSAGQASTGAAQSKWNSLASEDTHNSGRFFG